MSLDADRIKAMIDANERLTETVGGVRLRAQHPKHHGCVDAEFTVLDLPKPMSENEPDCRRGLFANPGTYRAKVRFSNGATKIDSESDAHGMAIKVFGVPGKPLLPGHEDESVQDFILVDSDVFFAGDLGCYTWLNNIVADRHEKLPKDKKETRWGKFKFKIGIFLTDPVLALRLNKFIKKKPGSPLTCDYFSATPYKLGDLKVKYVAHAKQKGPQGVEGEHGLFEALKAGLANQDAVFDFGVHVQRNEQIDPINDPTKSWSNGRRADQILATLTIPKQVVEKDANQAQELIFNPWHASAEHEPLGDINRVRRDIYDVLSKRRNGVCP